MNVNNIVLICAVMTVFALATPSFACDLSAWWNSTATTYSPTTYSHFNVTCDEINDEHHNVSIELNISGTLTNFTATNGSAGNDADTFNVSVILPANYGDTQVWAVFCSNATLTNASRGVVGYAVATAGQQIKLNMTYEGTTYSEQNVSVTVDSDKQITGLGYVSILYPGTITLSFDGTATSNPESRTTTVGTHNFSAVIAGTINYTANTTARVFWFTTQQSGGGGGLSTPVTSPPTTIGYVYSVSEEGEGMLDNATILAIIAIIVVVATIVIIKEAK